MATSQHWGSRISFIFATAAAAIGLGNIWRFPYLTGEHGGSAFVLVYLFFVFLLGIPLLLAETTIGRICPNDPYHSLKDIETLKHTRWPWRWVGGLSVCTCFLVLSYYSVISGWIIHYGVQAAAGHFHHLSQSGISLFFDHLQHNTGQMIFYAALVFVGMAVILSLGLQQGLEKTVLFLFPALLILLIILLIYASTTPGFHEAVTFLFYPDFSKLTPTVISQALGQAFFSLNVGLGVMILFSAYVPPGMPLVSSVIIIALADTFVALIAGLVIFPIVFSFHLNPEAGPSLIFKTLPLAFSQLPGGEIMTTLFFVMLFFAAFTSCLALLEPALAWATKQLQWTRRRAAICSAGLCFILSLATVLSFAKPELYHWHHMTYFEIIDFVTARIMLPVVSLWIAILVGWRLPIHTICDAMGWSSTHFTVKAWRFVLRWVAPFLILFILYQGL